MRLFGWLLVEPTNAAAPAALEQWCKDEMDLAGRHLCVSKHDTGGDRDSSDGWALPIPQG